MKSYYIDQNQIHKSKLKALSHKTINQDSIFVAIELILLAIALQLFLNCSPLPTGPSEQTENTQTKNKPIERFYYDIATLKMDHPDGLISLDSIAEGRAHVGLEYWIEDKTTLVLECNCEFELPIYYDNEEKLLSIDYEGIARDPYFKINPLQNIVIIIEP